MHGYRGHHFSSIAKFPTLKGQKQFAKAVRVPLSSLIAVEKGSPKPFKLFWDKALLKVNNTRQYQFFLRSLMATADNFKVNTKKHHTYDYFSHAIYTRVKSHEILAWATKQVCQFVSYPVTKVLKRLDKIDPSVPHFSYQLRKRILCYLKVYQAMTYKPAKLKVYDFVASSNRTVRHHIQQVCSKWHINTTIVNQLRVSNQPIIRLLEKALNNVKSIENYQDYLRLVVMSYGSGTLISLFPNVKQRSIALAILKQYPCEYNSLIKLTYLLTDKTGYHIQPMLHKLEQVKPNISSSDRYHRILTMKYFRLVRYLNNRRCAIPYTDIMRMNKSTAITNLTNLAIFLDVPKRTFIELMNGDSAPIHNLLKQTLQLAQTIRDFHNFLKLVVKLNGGLKSLIKDKAKYQHVADIMYGGKNTRKNMRTLAPLVHKLTGYPLKPLMVKVHEIMPARIKITGNQRSVILTYLTSYRDLHYSAAFCPIQAHFIMTLSEREAFRSLKQISQRLSLPLSDWDQLFNDPKSLLKQLRASALTRITNLKSLRQYLRMYLAAYPPLLKLTNHNYQQASLVDSAIHVDRFIVSRRSWEDIIKQIGDLTHQSLTPVLNQVKNNQIGIADNN